MECCEKREPLVSIMVTAYNSEKYIRDCLHSLQAQTYQKLEILVVDDGSTDATGEICDAMAREDDRIRVIHQKNGGVSRARNTAVREARGDYLAFVDSDDYVAENYVEEMLQMAQQYDADVVCCGFQKTHERYGDKISVKKLERTAIREQETGEAESQKQEVQRTANREQGIWKRRIRRRKTEASEDSPQKAPEILDGKNVRSRLYTTQRMYYMVCWNKLYRRGMFDGLTFPEGLLHEDEDVLAELFGRAQQVVSSEQVLYYYYMSPDSIMRGPYQVERMGILLTYRRRMRMFAAEGNQELAESSRRQCMTAALMQYYLCRRDRSIDPRYGALCLKCFRQSLPFLHRSRTVPAGYKLFFRAANRFPYLAGWLIELKSNRFSW